MVAQSIEDLRRPHPDQARIDAESARTLRRTAALLWRNDAGFFSPRRGLAPAVSGIAPKTEPTTDPDFEAA